MIQKQQIIGILAAACALPLSGNTLINETWADGERFTQDLSNNSMAWFSSSGTSTVDVSVGELRQNTGGSGRHILGYFTDAGSPVSIGMGEILQVNFTVSFPRGEPLGDGNDFRVGVWDSGGARVSADNHGGTGTGSAIADFENYAGYIFAGGLDESRSISIRKRNTGTAGILIASTSVYDTLGSTQSDNLTATPGVVYDGVLSLARTGADEMSISYSMTDGTITLAEITRVDASGIYTSFDTVGFVMGSNVADAYVLNQVEISVIPEPSAAAALSGIAVLAAVVFYRRRTR